MRHKSNKNLKFIDDKSKSYVYVYEGKKSIGIFMWHYKKKKWVFEPDKIIKRKK